MHDQLKFIECKFRDVSNNYTYKREIYNREDKRKFKFILIQEFKYDIHDPNLKKIAY